MLDVGSYRLSENLARTYQPHFTYSQTHNLSAFKQYGFPITVENVDGLRQFVDAFHEGQFEELLVEQDGFTQEEWDLFSTAISQNIEMQSYLFPGRPQIIPYSSMLSTLLVYNKIMSMKDNVSTVLEVGPGSGALSFFLNQNESLRLYSQIEVCESLYLLQSAVNHHSFGQHAFEHAYSSVDKSDEFFGGVVRPPWTEHGDEIDYFIKTTPEIRCEHYPWWKIGKISEKKNFFDIITSNANFNEFSDTALHFYLRLFNDILKEDGAIIVQCPGADHQNRFADLVSTLTLHGFAIVTYAPEKLCINQNSNGKESRKLVNGNLILVKKGHPFYQKYCCNDFDASEYFFASENFVSRMFFSFNPEKKWLSKNDLKEKMLSHLKEVDAAANVTFPNPRQDEPRESISRLD